MSSRFEPRERTVVLGVGGILSMRILGISLVLPVVALHAASLTDSALLIGLAAGAYGVTMAALQIPLGALSDKIGRKPVLLVGMGLFALGAASAAVAPTAEWLVAARFLQGAGAVSSAATAFVADQVSPARRGTAMALIGAPIGAAFTGGLVFGPVLAGAIGVRGIFWLTAALALAAEAVLLLLVHEDRPRAGALARRWDVRKPLGDLDLRRADFTGFVNNFTLMSFFVAMQLSAVSALGLAPADLWRITLPMAAAGGVLMFLAGRAADAGHLRAASASAAVLLVGGPLVLLSSLGQSVFGVIAGGVLLFAGFSSLETLLLTLVAGLADPAQRGLSTGVFNTSQFLGSASGATAGAILLAHPAYFAAILVVLGGIAVWAMATVRVDRRLAPPLEALARDAG